MKFFAAGLILLSTTALSASPTGRVGGATVTKGLLSFEQRNSYSFDDEDRENDRIRSRQHIDYGVTDRYAIRLMFAQNKFKGDNLQASTYRIENRFHLIHKENYGWDGGIRLTYNGNESRTDEVRVRFAGQGPLTEQWQWRHNTLIDHDIGAGTRHGLGLAFRTGALYDTQYSNNLIKNVKIGPTLYNTIGRLRDDNTFEEQQHQLGVIAKISLHDNLYGEVLYRRGLTSTTVQDLAGLTLGIKF